MADVKRKIVNAIVNCDLGVFFEDVDPEKNKTLDFDYKKQDPDTSIEESRQLAGLNEFLT